MAVFKYQGRNSSGGQVSGTVEANNESMAADQLARQQIIITDITAADVSTPGKSYRYQ